MIGAPRSGIRVVDTGHMSREAFEAFYASHARQLVRFLLYRIGDTALAEDLAADTFERVIRTRRPFDARIATERTWLYTIALNVLRDHLRRRGAEDRAIERVGRPDTCVAPGEADVVLRDEVSRALRALNAAEREVVALRYGADLSVPQIAAATGAKPAAIEKRLYRALAKLRGELTGGRDDALSASDGATPVAMPSPGAGSRRFECPRAPRGYSVP